MRVVVTAEKYRNELVAHLVKMPLCDNTGGVHINRLGNGLSQLVNLFQVVVASGSKFKSVNQVCSPYLRELESRSRS